MIDFLRSFHNTKQLNIESVFHPIWGLMHADIDICSNTVAFSSDTELTFIDGYPVVSNINNPNNMVLKFCYTLRPTLSCKKFQTPGDFIENVYKIDRSQLPILLPDFSFLFNLLAIKFITVVFFEKNAAIVARYKDKYDELRSNYDSKVSKNRSEYSEASLNLIADLLAIITNIDKPDELIFILLAFHNYIAHNYLSEMECYNVFYRGLLNEDIQFNINNTIFITSDKMTPKDALYSTFNTVFNFQTSLLEKFFNKIIKTPIPSIFAGDEISKQLVPDKNILTDSILNNRNESLSGKVEEIPQQKDNLKNFVEEKTQYLEKYNDTLKRLDYFISNIKIIIHTLLYDRTKRLPIMLAGLENEDIIINILGFKLKMDPKLHFITKNYLENQVDFDTNVPEGLEYINTLDSIHIDCENELVNINPVNLVNFLLVLFSMEQHHEYVWKPFIDCSTKKNLAQVYKLLFEKIYSATNEPSDWGVDVFLDTKDDEVSVYSYKSDYYKMGITFKNKKNNLNTITFEMILDNNNLKIDLCDNGIKNSIDPGLLNFSSYYIRDFYYNVNFLKRTSDIYDFESFYCTSLINSEQICNYYDKLIEMVNNPNATEEYKKKAHKFVKKMLLFDNALSFQKPEALKRWELSKFYTINELPYKYTLLDFYNNIPITTSKYETYLEVFSREFYSLHLDYYDSYQTIFNQISNKYQSNTPIEDYLESFLLILLVIEDKFIQDPIFRLPNNFVNLFKNLNNRLFESMYKGIANQDPHNLKVFYRYILSRLWNIDTNLGIQFLSFDNFSPLINLCVYEYSDFFRYFSDYDPNALNEKYVKLQILLDKGNKEDTFNEATLFTTFQDLQPLLSNINSFLEVTEFKKWTDKESTINEAKGFFLDKISTLSNILGLTSKSVINPEVPTAIYDEIEVFKFLLSPTCIIKLEKEAIGLLDEDPSNSIYLIDKITKTENFILKSVPKLLIHAEVKDDEISTMIFNLIFNLLGLVEKYSFENKYYIEAIIKYLSFLKKFNYKIPDISNFTSFLSVYMESENYDWNENLEFLLEILDFSEKSKFDIGKFYSLFDSTGMIDIISSFTTLKEIMKKIEKDDFTYLNHESLPRMIKLIQNVFGDMFFTESTAYIYKVFPSHHEKLNQTLHPNYLSYLFAIVNFYINKEASRLVADENLLLMRGMIINLARNLRVKIKEIVPIQLRSKFALYSANFYAIDYRYGIKKEKLINLLRGKSVSSLAKLQYIGKCLKNSHPRFLNIITELFLRYSLFWKTVMKYQNYYKIFIDFSNNLIDESNLPVFEIEMDFRIIFPISTQSYGIEKLEANFYDYNFHQIYLYFFGGNFAQFFIFLLLKSARTNNEILNYIHMQSLLARIDKCWVYET